MATLTWKGEDELHGEGAGPSFTLAHGGIKFPKGEGVEVRSHAIVQKAINNPFFDVDDADDVDDAPGKPLKRGRPSNAEKAAKEAADREPKDPLIPGPLPGDPAPGTASE